MLPVGLGINHHGILLHGTLYQERVTVSTITDKIHLESFHSMKCNIIFLVSCIAGAFVDEPTFSIVHESREDDSQLSRWQKLDKLPADTIVPVRLALKQRNTDRGMDLLMEV